MLYGLLTAREKIFVKWDYWYPLHGFYQIKYWKDYELINLRALRFSPVNEMHIFQCMGKIFCEEFQRSPFEIPHKISYPYIERCDFYTTLKFKELLNLRSHKYFWNAPW